MSILLLDACPGVGLCLLHIVCQPPLAFILPLLHACPGCPCPRACSPWPALDSMRGKVIVTLVLNGGTDMAARFQEAFPNLGACPPGSCQPAGVDRCLLHAPGMFLPLALWHCC